VRGGRKHGLEKNLSYRNVKLLKEDPELLFECKSKEREKEK
jgi:hypothetical protein